MFIYSRKRQSKWKNAVRKRGVYVKKQDDARFFSNREWKWAIKIGIIWNLDIIYRIR